MTADVIIAVRGGPDAKSRLASRLSLNHRRALIAAMLEDMIGAIASSQRRPRVWVVTPTSEIADLAGSLGASALPEAGPDGLNAAFSGAMRHVRSRADPAPLILLPGDLPLLRAADLDTLVALAEAHAIVLAPAESDGGTGAVGLGAGVDFIPQFGADSWRRHSRQAEQNGRPWTSLRSPSLGRDLDRLEDLAPILAAGPGPRTAALLAELLAS